MRFSPAVLLLSMAVLLLPAPADAQTTERPLFKWFAPKQPDKSTPRPASAPDPRRLAEINIEIAWLADPVTFPYYLEARSNGGNMEVRGYVPGKAVREHALRLAQVHASAPVVDAMKEHPSLLVRPSPMTPQELQRRIVSALREALPKSSQQLQVQLAPDGKVFVHGAIPTHEDKLTVSLSLRRLHGCTSVQNQTQVPNDPAVAQGNNPLADPKKAPFQATSNPATKPNDNAVVNDPKAKPIFGVAKGTNGKPAKDDNRGPAPLPKLIDVPAPAPQPQLTFEPPATKKPVDPFVPLVKEEEVPKFKPAPPPVVNDEPKSPPKVPIFRVDDSLPPQIPLTPIAKSPPFTPPAKTPTPEVTPPPLTNTPAPAKSAPVDGALLAKLEKRMKETCPELLNVRLVVKANNEIEVEATVRKAEDVERVATRIYTSPDYQTYKLDLKFMVGK